MPLNRLVSRCRPALLTLGLLGAALLSQAQVMRCTDPATGKVTYTDGACQRGNAAAEVEPRKSPEDIAQERQQAAEALERKQRAQQAEAAADRAAAQQEARVERTRPHAAADPAQSAECAAARRAVAQVNSELGRGLYDEQTRLDTAQRQMDLACLSPAAYAEAERARATRPVVTAPIVVVPPRPIRPTPQPRMTHCNVFRCYDAQGNTYPR